MLEGLDPDILRMQSSSLNTIQQSTCGLYTTNLVVFNIIKDNQICSFNIIHVSSAGGYEIGGPP